MGLDSGAVQSVNSSAPVHPQSTDWVSFPSLPPLLEKAGTAVRGPRRQRGAGTSLGLKRQKRRASPQVKGVALTHPVCRAQPRRAIRVFQQQGPNRELTPLP